MRPPVVSPARRYVHAGCPLQWRCGMGSYREAFLRIAEGSTGRFEAVALPREVVDPGCPMIKEACIEAAWPSPGRCEQQQRIGREQRWEPAWAGDKDVETLALA